MYRLRGSGDRFLPNARAPLLYDYFSRVPRLEYERRVKREGEGTREEFLQNAWLTYHYFSLSSSERLSCTRYLSILYKVEYEKWTKEEKEYYSAISALYLITRVEYERHMGKGKRIPLYD